MHHLTEGNLKQVWRRYIRDRHPDDRGELVKHYSYLVNITVGRIVGVVPQGLEREDLISAGTMGLIRAVDQFDPSRLVKFETYAIALIRGAVLEMLRSEDWVPRSIREKLKALDKAYIALQLQLNRPPTEEEIADALEISVEELHELQVFGARHAVLSLDEMIHGNDSDESGNFLDVLIDEDADPDAQTQERELRRLLALSVDKLPDRERLVIALYYFEGLTFREIGAVLGVSESRVYQLHAQAVGRIRAFMSEELGARVE